MINLMVGNNFDMKFIDILIKLNKKYEGQGIKVNEAFGSIRKLRTKHITTARPDFRVPDIDENEFKNICKKLTDNGIRINYTINSPLIDHKEITKTEVENFINHLVKDFNVSRVTVAHPLLMKLISKVSNIDIEVSTIYHLRHPRQILDLQEMVQNITKLCLDVNLNRDRFAIEEQKSYCDQLGIDLELIANEFCIQHCIVRDQCYQAHVINKVVEDTLHHESFPMGYCISHREKYPREWLSANFILPQQMKLYKKLFDINCFKITGRTAPTKYLSWIVEEYLKQDFNDNLLMLWQDVKNLKRVADGQIDYLPPKYEIDSSKINCNFLKFYLETEKPITFKSEAEHINKYLKKALKK